MTIQHKRLLPFLILIGTTSATAQHLIFGATANFGMSQVSSDLPISGNYQIQFAPSGNAGVFVEKKIFKKSYLGVEMLWVQIEGKEVTTDKELTIFDGQNVIATGVISDQARLHSSYLGLPLYYRIGIGKFGIKAGIQPMLFLFASSNYKASGTLNRQPFETKSNEKGIQLNRIDWGPKIGIDYRLNNQFRLRADYYHGFSDFTSDEFPWERKNMQICLGVQYAFWGKEKKIEKQ